MKRDVIYNHKLPLSVKEKIMPTILDKFKLLGDSTSALYHLDNELAKMAQNPSVDSAGAAN